MSGNVSPEEKLLRLIRGKNSDQAAGQGVQQSGHKDVLGPIISSIKSVSLRNILLILFVISWICLIASHLYSWMGLKTVKLPEVMIDNASGLSSPQAESVSSQKPYESYLQAAGNRQIFGSSQAGAQSQERPAVAGGDLVKDISLVAIIKGESPQAAIEDKKTQKTYYVSKGQYVGDFLIEDVHEGKIILNSKGQRFELYL